IEQTIPAILLDPLWNLLGFNKLKLTPKVFKDRLGVFGEPTSLGVILGIIIGILGNLNNLTDIDAWGEILKFAIQRAGIMKIFPIITEVVAKAFSPMADANDSRQKEEMKEKTHLKRWLLVIDDGVGYGEPATIISGMILIPIMVLLAFVLPCNRTL